MEPLLLSLSLRGAWSTLLNHSLFTLHIADENCCDPGTVLGPADILVSKVVEDLLSRAALGGSKPGRERRPQASKYILLNCESPFTGLNCKNTTSYLFCLSFGVSPCFSTNVLDMMDANSITSYSILIKYRASLEFKLKLEAGRSGPCL